MFRRLDGVDGGPEEGVVVLEGELGRRCGVGDLDGGVEEGLGVGGALLEGRRVLGLLALLGALPGTEVEGEEEAAVEVRAPDVPGGGGVVVGLEGDEGAGGVAEGPEERGGGLRSASGGCGALGRPWRGGRMG